LPLANGVLGLVEALEEGRVIFLTLASTHGKKVHKLSRLFPSSQKPDPVTH